MLHLLTVINVNSEVHRLRDECSSRRHERLRVAAAAVRSHVNGAFDWSEDFTHTTRGQVGRLVQN